jgi:hypothetical protein
MHCFVVIMMKLDSTDLTMTTPPASTKCWCGSAIAIGEKRTLFGVTWCAECFARILRACPRALRNAQRWTDGE